MIAVANLILLFLFTTVVSFIGSLQAGLVNMAVLATTVRSGRDAGRRMAIGGALPEFVHAGLAFAFTSWVKHHWGANHSTIVVVASGFLIALGVYFLFFFRPALTRSPTELPATNGYLKGFLLGLANPQLLLFWCGIRLSMDVFGSQVGGPVDLLAFAGGATFGALILLLLVVRLGSRVQERMDPRKLRVLFRVVGAILIAIGLVGVVRSVSASSAAATNVDADRYDRVLQAEWIGPTARYPGFGKRGEWIAYASRSLSRRISSTGAMRS